MAILVLFQIKSERKNVVALIIRKKKITIKGDVGAKEFINQPSKLNPEIAARSGHID
jgi:hypothetical protein